MVDQPKQSQMTDAGVCCPVREGPLWEVAGALRCGECWNPDDLPTTIPLSDHVIPADKM